ncbi:MAG TPA: carboxypeptidase regulatory-like domain-containing protein [Candidatus Angelobacter sp.]|nr:carboxypeptidase regulatory-like domain-containing protein [Candidatus Angelobacter sp.]
MALRRTSLICILISVLGFASGAFTQTESATVSGRVTDTDGAVVAGTEVQLESVERGIARKATTNDAGIYIFSGVQPGLYHMTIMKQGFRQVELTGLVLNVQDHVEKNFRLQVGSALESVTVTAEAPLVNTNDASVSTVVDRQFADRLPLNGRSFQSLIELTPGVVVTQSNFEDGGQFSVNGQRASSNYWSIDGVSGNIGIGVSNGVPGNGLGGVLGSFSAIGGTNSLVSVDALQEFRIQTSTYAPEFGRTPGGQISIVTRSGTNQFHGTAFDYLRNDALDANNWFNGFTNSQPLPKAKERQNDFGGTLGGPIIKDRTFFFFSYEGLRLRLPQTVLSTVPDVNARQNAIPALQPFLNAFPLPNGSDDVTKGIAQFNSSFSNPGTLDAYSLRIDHQLRHNLTLFARYNYSPSETRQRGTISNESLSTISSNRITTQTATLGAAYAVSPNATNDFRFNYSRTNAAGVSSLDNFGGAVPLASLPLPSPFNPNNSLFTFFILSLTRGNSFATGPSERNALRQINLVDSVSLQEGTHGLKFGIDYRRLSPSVTPFAYVQTPFFMNVPSAENGTAFFGEVGQSTGATLLLRNLGVYAQDTWKMFDKLTLTYGIRWDVDFVPQSLAGPSLAALSGFNLQDLSQLAPAATGNDPFSTRYANFAPRVGLAYQLFGKQRSQTVLRGGFGVFYDLVSSETGNAGNFEAGYPFANFTFFRPSAFPFSAQATAPPPLAPPTPSSPSNLSGFDPNLRLPYTLEWNGALEHTLGQQQVITLSYVGSVGRRLLQTALIQRPNPSVTKANLVTNGSTSDYDALQVQFQRRLSRGLQILTSYTWSHSIDTSSAGSNAVFSNVFVPNNPGANRGSSDFDIRNTFNAGVTYDIPLLRRANNVFLTSVTRGWSIESLLQARSATPVDVNANATFGTFAGGISGDTRPDFVPGQPVYLFGSAFPGGKGLNPMAFVNPPLDPMTKLPARQGTVPRNAFRGFGAVQWDLAVHRDFPIYESLNLQFRAEMFNVVNHPNFGPPNPRLGTGDFGLSSGTLNQTLTGVNGAGAGAFNPLYQIGGPRSVQLALKLLF